MNIYDDNSKTIIILYLWMLYYLVQKIYLEEKSIFKDHKLNFVRHIVNPNECSFHLAILLHASAFR